MPQTIDWLYHRKNCTTCKRARAYMTDHKVAVKDETNAAKERRSPAEALALAKKAGRVIVARGKKVVTFDMTKDRPSDEVLLAHLIGPSGNLRAPTARVGDTLLVGFTEEIYKNGLGN